jgi:cardiolipin synthase
MTGPANTAAQTASRWRHLPNAITLLRIVLVVPLVAVIARADFNAALILVVIAGASDALDGLLAKRFGWQSWLGGVLDPIADKTLLVACFVSLWFAGVMPAWLMGLALLRDAVILSGAVIYHFTVGRFTPEPLLTSKVTTVLQIALVVALLIDRTTWFALPATLLQMLVWATALATVVSGVQYVLLWSHKAREVWARRARR